MKRTLVFAGVMSAALVAFGGIVVYPEYDARIERDYAYTVSVSQGAQPVAFEAHFFSNEKRTVAKFVVPSDGAWHTFSETMKLDFDSAVTALAAFQFKVSVPADELCFKNLALVKETD